MNVALTFMVMKCFEKLMKDLICSSLPSSLDPLQFAYRSTDDILSHLNIGKGNYAHLLSIDYSLAFNITVPNLRDLRLSYSLCS